MTIEIELDGERHLVALRREGEQWIAGIAGRELVVSVAAAGNRWSMLVGPSRDLPPEGGSHDRAYVASGFSRKSFEVAIESAPGGELLVHVDGVVIPATIVNGRSRGRRRGRDGGPDHAPRAIVAPMPGRIVRVLVKLHEVVAARQPLVVVEAMKMENELRAPRDGTVAEIRVREGSSVEANAVLVVLE